jgi:hypothetical protein
MGSGYKRSQLLVAMAWWSLQAHRRQTSSLVQSMLARRVREDHDVRSISNWGGYLDESAAAVSKCEVRTGKLARSRGEENEVTRRG